MRPGARWRPASTIRPRHRPAPARDGSRDAPELARRRETRFFHPDRIAGRQQRARQQCQTGPMARRDEDLPGSQPRRAKPTDRPRSPAAASSRPDRHKPYRPDSGARNLLAASRSHCLRGKASSAGMPSWNGGGAASKPCMAATPGAGATAAPAGGASAPRPARGHHGLAGPEVALAHELAVGQVHRAARHAQLAGQTARRRHRSPGASRPCSMASRKRRYIWRYKGSPWRRSRSQRGTGRAFHGPVFVQIWLFQLSHGSPNLAA